MRKRIAHGAADASAACGPARRDADQPGAAHATLSLMRSGELSVWLDSGPAAQAAADASWAGVVLACKEIARIAPDEALGEQSLIAGQLPNAWAIAAQNACLLALPEVDAVRAARATKPRAQAATGGLRLAADRAWTNP